MTDTEKKETIELFRKIVLPRYQKALRIINYEGMGETDAKEFKRDFNEILDLATKALEQEPCEDAISRKNVWSMITGGKYPNENDEQFIDRLVEGLEKMSSVTPTRKVGKWEYIGDNCFKCTKCGEVYTVDQFNHINNYCDNRFPKGCPNCGAKMVEPQESEG